MDLGCALYVWIYLVLEVKSSCVDCDPAMTASCYAGACTCSAPIMGTNCNQVTDGFYMPDLDYHRLYSVESTCKIALSSQQQVLSGLHEVATVCNGSLGAGERHVRFQTLDERKQNAELSSYRVIVRHVYSGQHSSVPAKLLVRPGGQNHRNTADTMRCPLSPDQTTTHNMLFNKASDEVFATQQLHVLCAYTFELLVTLPDERNFSLTVDSLTVLPNLLDFLIYKNADSVTKNEYLDCLTNYSSATTTNKTPACEDMAFSVMAELMKEPLRCDCRAGSRLSSCARVGGQCPCKVGVTGRTCDHCLPGYHRFSDKGCEVCSGGQCNTFVSNDAFMGVVTVICVSLVAILSLILIMFLPTSKYGRLCACYDEDKKLEKRKTHPEAGLKIQRTYSVRGNLESYVNISMAPIGLQQDNDLPKSEQMSSGYKRRDSIRSLGPFMTPTKSGGTGRQKGRGKTQATPAPKTTARMGSGLGAGGF